jgi:beta-mannosidase
MAACTSAVDYYAQPKPAYHAVARAYAPLLLSAQFARIAWQDADPFAAAIWTSYAGESALENVKIQAQLISAGSEAGSHRTFAEWEWSVRVMPNASQEHALIQVDLASAVDDVFFLDLALVDHDGTRLARNRYPFSRGQTLAPFLNLPAPDLETSIEQDGNRWLVIVTNAGPCAAPGVWLEADRHGAGWAYFDDNFIHLLPAEQRAITVRWEGITPQERTLTLQALNGGTRVIHG